MTQCTIKGNQRVKQLETQPDTRTCNHHRQLPPVITPTLSCRVSHKAPSVLQSVLRSSASLWSQDKDLCRPGLFDLRPGVFTYSADSNIMTFSKPNWAFLGLFCLRQWLFLKEEVWWSSLCVDCRFTCRMCWCINVSTCRMEMHNLYRWISGFRLLLCYSVNNQDFVRLSECGAFCSPQATLSLWPRESDIGITVYVCVWERQASPRGLDSKAELTHAGKGSTALRLEPPAELSVDSGPPPYQYITYYGTRKVCPALAFKCLNTHLFYFYLSAIESSSLEYLTLKMTATLCYVMSCLLPWWWISSRCLDVIWGI